MKKKTITKPSVTQHQVVGKHRGSATTYDDGSIEFRPDAESDKKLYESVKETRKASLQKTDKIYKISLKTDIESVDPYHQLLKEFQRVAAPLLPKDAGKHVMADDEEVVARTESSVVTKTKDEVIIVTRLSRNVPNPDVQHLLPILSAEQKRHLQLYVPIINLFTNETAKLCSYISVIGKTK